LTVIRLDAKVVCVNREVYVSAKVGIPALENFKLCYEEIVNIRPRRNRLRRVRSAASANTN
jgi:hypothetical protein